VLKRFIIRTVTFIGLIFPAAFAVALLAAPAQPAIGEQRGCAEQITASQGATMMSQARLGTGYGVDVCDAAH
jgi:hypothetical protein